MPQPLKFRPRAVRGRQGGQALLIFLAIITGGFLAILYGTVGPVSGKTEREKATAAALAQAKEALIGRAASDSTRPGSLPCPDTDNDGSAELFAGSDCPAYIGRLPWRTLGLPDPRDGSGERLWYALFPVFRDNSAAGMLDVDTKGGLTIYRDSTATVLTAEAVAVVFAPGSVVSGQVRDAANSNIPANYLDTTGGVNNAIASGPFISAQPSATFNDRVLVITTVDLMPAVEMRVAREMLALLSAYKANSACNCYPWASNDFDDDSVSGRRFGMVPIEDALPENWGSGGIPSVPAWIIGSNEWGKRFYYAIASSVTATPTPGTLTVDGTSKDLVIITPGPASASRPSTNLSDYFEDAENRNNDNIFCSPGPSPALPCIPTAAYARDRLYTLP